MQLILIVWFFSYLKRWILSFRFWSYFSVVVILILIQKWNRNYKNDLRQKINNRQLSTHRKPSILLVTLIISSNIRTFEISYYFLANIFKSYKIQKPNQIQISDSLPLLSQIAEFLLQSKIYWSKYKQITIINKINQKHLILNDHHYLFSWNKNDSSFL